MERYKLFVTVPDNDKQINEIINAASEAGAGNVGNYANCAFIQKGQGNFLPGDEASPHIGKVGEMGRVDEVKIEMECPVEKAKEVKEAIIKVHPYEEVVIDFMKLEDTD